MTPLAPVSPEEADPFEWQPTHDEGGDEIGRPEGPLEERHVDPYAMGASEPREPEGDWGLARTVVGSARRSTRTFANPAPSEEREHANLEEREYENVEEPSAHRSADSAPSVQESDVASPGSPGARREDFGRRRGRRR